MTSVTTLYDDSPWGSTPIQLTVPKNVQLGRYNKNGELRK